MWRSNKVIVLVNVGQVEVVDFKFFFSSKINNHKDGDSAYVVAGRKLSSEEPVTVLEKGRFHTFSERSSISLAHFNNNNNKNNNKKRQWTIAYVRVIVFPQPVFSYCGSYLWEKQ